MEKFRSKSCREGKMQTESWYGSQKAAPTSMQDLRSFSVNNYAFSMHPNSMEGKEVVKIKKGKKSDPGSISKSWSFNIDPELQRKKRVASYKVYSIEGKMKGSLRKSFKWIKNTCTKVVYG